jgi:hypothetical protein
LCLPDGVRSNGWLKAHGYIKTKIAKKVTEHPVFVYVMRAGVAIEKKPFYSLRLAFENYKDRLSGGTGITGDKYHNFRSMVNKKADGYPYNVILLNNYEGDALRVLDTEFITEEKSVDQFGLEVTKLLAAKHFFSMRGPAGKILNAKELSSAMMKINLKIAKKLQKHPNSCLHNNSTKTPKGF